MDASTGLSGEWKIQNSNLKNGLVNYGFEPWELESVGVHERIGIYLIGNYSREDEVLESMMVEPVAFLIKNLELPKIDKLCLVACGAARVGTSTKDNKKYLTANQNANEKCFIYNLCQHLHPLTPMIAGWDGYVEVSTSSHPHGATGSKFTQQGVQKRVIQFKGGKPEWQLKNAGWSDKNI
jgi:hypothetical protein